ncbi:MAG: hypothetical protein AAF399_20745 [Bacteroidota bacterium]
MKRTIKIAALVFLGSIVLTKQNLCEHPDGKGFGQMNALGGQASQDQESLAIQGEGTPVNDSIYQWNDQHPGWSTTTTTPVQTVSFVSHDWLTNGKGVQLTWQLLTSIQYQLEYFPSLETEMYTPIFGPKLEKLDGKQVELSGYVIPFDPSGRFVALSANPMASCFFCGKASPASIMSLHLEDQEEQYQIDDYRKFTGTLQLNHDDPNEYYYILKEARPLATP